MSTDTYKGALPWTSCYISVFRLAVGDRNCKVFWMQ